MKKNYSEQLRAMMPVADMLGKTIECTCGRKHRADIDEVVIGRGAVNFLPELLQIHEAKSVFLLADTYTYAAAGEKITEVLRASGVEVTQYIYAVDNGEWVIPDEKAMQDTAQAYEQCGRPDILLSVGSGTMNDLGKAVAAMTGCKEQWVAATAASMDGYASNVSCLVRGSMKVTEGCNPPRVIIGDTQFLASAPREMTLAGIGDMAAKYNANMDWKLGHIINGEPYCEFIANGMLEAADQVIDLGLEAPEEGAFSDAFYEKLMTGLVLSGVYMSYNTTSRPASGAEHHFSHFLEMWLQVNHRPAIYHGTKVGVGALIMERLNQEFLNRDIEARRVVPRHRSFDEEAYKKTLERVYGAAAPALLKNYHYDAESRISRLNIIVENRRRINAAIREMLPSLEKMRKCMEHLGAVLDWTGLPCITGEIAAEALLYCKEMRSTYTILQVMTDIGYNLRNFLPNLLRNGYLTTDQIQIRDPFILPVPEEGKYYMFGTTSPSGWKDPAIGFDCYVSTDLEHWEFPIPVFRPEEGFFGVRHFWAPEVHRYKDKFYMFATFENAEGRRGTAILRSEKAAGPYTLLSNGPVTPADWDSLDGTFVLDGKGRPWMIFSHEWTQIVDGTICAMPLNKAMTGTAGKPTALFHASEAPWSRSSAYYGDETKRVYVTDGPFIVRHEDEEGKEILIMLWSTFGENGYMNGSAYSEKGILGPWIQNEQPVFTKDGGHGMVFHTFDGRMMMSLHQPNKEYHERAHFFEVKIDGHAIVPVDAAQAEGEEPSETVAECIPEAVDEAHESAKERCRRLGIVQLNDELPVYLL